MKTREVAVKENSGKGCSLAAIISLTLGYFLLVQFLHILGTAARGEGLSAIAQRLAAKREDKRQKLNQISDTVS